jgi:hypothetical protein
MDFIIKTDAVLHTDGRGFWTDVKGTVKLVKLVMHYINADRDYVEFRVYFDPKTWDVSENGLIYTDPKFMLELRDFLISLGLAGINVDYSEQSMQGDDYVSCDVNAEFINSWKMWEKLNPNRTYDWDDIKFKKETLSWLIEKTKSDPVFAVKIVQRLNKLKCPWSELKIIERNLNLSRVKKLAGL